MKTRPAALWALLLLLLLPTACEDPASEGDGASPLPAEGEELAGSTDLPLGELGPADLKADGVWGAATQCKPSPEYPRLVEPSITISVDGLTLRLSDPATGYDKVFPVGVGAMDRDDTSLTYGESLSYYPVLRTGAQRFEIRPSTVTPCKIWWTDGATGQRLPVFAGLPFLSWYGNYGIHGPIDGYREANGGHLRRGYVSHGCVRMEAADLLEVYGRTRGVARVPVFVQREAERDAAGLRRDVPSPWLGAECQADEDCPMADGFCKQNPYSGRGFCSVRCSRYCPDRAGYPVSFCVEDDEAPGQGMCVLKQQAENLECRPYDHLIPELRSRIGQAGVTATVCVPGSHGWVGDRCFADDECLEGNHCLGQTDDAPGICSQGCSLFCPDQPGSPWTFCVNEAGLGAGPTCLRQCDPTRNAPECSGGMVCASRTRANRPGTDRAVCVFE